MSSYSPEGLDVPIEQISERVPLLTHLGIRMVPSDRDDAICAEMAVAEEIFNLQGTPHGGALATLIDYCGAITCARLTPFRGTTADLHIRYLAAPRGSVIRSEGTVVRAGRRLCIIDVAVTDELGTDLAAASMAIAPFNASSEQG